MSLVVAAGLSGPIGLPAITGMAQTASEPLPASGHGAQAPPTGPVATLEVTGALAVGPTGALFVAAPLQHQILVRLADGQNRVVAGNGKRGFSGDGGQAVDAELTSPRDLTFGPTGSLYFVDGGRVRVVGTDGVVRTIAGNGAGVNGVSGSSSPPVADGTPALSASLGPSPSIALSPAGQLYLGTANQLLRLSNGGLFQTVRTHQVPFTGPTGLPGTLDMNLGSLAVDSAGNLDVAGFNGWGIWRVAHDGAATYLGYAPWERRPDPRPRPRAFGRGLRG